MKVMAKPAYSDLYARTRESVKRRVSRWPSAYASAQLVREYKALVRARYGPNAQPYGGPRNVTPGRLTRWFGEKWVDISTMRPCGSVKSETYYPVCRPAHVARRLTPAQIARAVSRKQLSKTKTTRYFT